LLLSIQILECVQLVEHQSVNIDSIECILEAEVVQPEIIAIVKQTQCKCLINIVEVQLALITWTIVHLIICIRTISIVIVVILIIINLLLIILLLLVQHLVELRHLVLVILIINWLLAVVERLSFV
jgi:hypothetical protein